MTAARFLILVEKMNLFRSYLKKQKKKNQRRKKKIINEKYYEVFENEKNETYCLHLWHWYENFALFAVWNVFVEGIFEASVPTNWKLSPTAWRNPIWSFLGLKRSLLPRIPAPHLVCWWHPVPDKCTGMVFNMISPDSFQATFWCLKHGLQTLHFARYPSKVKL